MIDRREFLALGAAALAPASAPGGVMKAEFLLTKAGEVLQLPFAAKQLQVANLTPNSVYVNFNGEIPTSSRYAWEIAAFQSELSVPVNTGMVAYAATQNPTPARLTAFDSAIGPAQQIKSEASPISRPHIENKTLTGVVGTQSIETDPVPAGIVRVVSHVAVKYLNTCSSLRIEVYDGSSVFNLLDQVGVTGGQGYDRHTRIALVNPLRIVFWVTGATDSGSLIGSMFAHDLRSGFAA